MFKRNRKRARWVGPLFAYEAIRLHLEGKRELDAAAQLSEGRS